MCDGGDYYDFGECIVCFFEDYYYGWFVIVFVVVVYEVGYVI